MLEMSLEKGELSIVDEVIKIIAEMALTEVDGVTVSSSFIKGKLLEKVKIGRNAIKIQTNNDKFIITMQVGVVYGKNIPKTIQELQQIIKNHVELFTGFPVEEVNVIVNQIINEL